MQNFQYKYSIQVDSDGALGGIYVMLNDDISVQTIAQSSHGLYLFVKVK